MINCIFWVLLLLISMVLLKCTNSPPIVSSIGTFNQNLVRYLCNLLPRLAPNDYYCKAFSFVSQIKNANLSRKVLVFYDVYNLFTNVQLQETIDIAINHIFNHNPNIKVTKKEIFFFSFLLNHRLILFLTVRFITKSMVQPWVLPWLMSLLISSWVFANVSA